MGGYRTFAAFCTKVHYAQIVYFAKSNERPKAAVRLPSGAALQRCRLIKSNRCLRFTSIKLSPIEMASFERTTGSSYLYLVLICEL